MAGTAGLGSVRFVTVMLSVVLVGTVSASVNPLVLQSHLWLVSSGSVVALAGPVLVAASPG